MRVDESGRDHELARCRRLDARDDTVLDLDPQALVDALARRHDPPLERQRVSSPVSADEHQRASTGSATPS